MNTGQRVLVCATTWLGDSIMSLPAVQAFKQARPADRLTVLAKAGMAPLWHMHADVEECIEYRPDSRGVLTVCQTLRACRFDEAYIFPNSFRSALIPFLAGIPVRVGQSGHGRRKLLTEEITLTADVRAAHQAYEYFAILRLAAPPDCPPPRLRVPVDVLPAAPPRLGLDVDRPWVALMPGAARGASKRWPAPYFAAVGRWVAQRGLAVVVLGSGAEQEACAAVAAGVGPDARNLAGRTDLATLTAILGRCRAAVTNDSGGMHLAAAAGTRVVAVFGLTDPRKTAPLGPGHHVVSAEGVARSRDIARTSRAAEECLRALRPETVTAALEQVLAGGET